MHCAPMSGLPNRPACARICAGSGITGAVPAALMKADRPVASGSCAEPASAGASMEHRRDSSHASAPALKRCAPAACTCACKEC